MNLGWFYKAFFVGVLSDVNNCRLSAYKFAEPCNNEVVTAKFSVNINIFKLTTSCMVTSALELCPPSFTPFEIAYANVHQ
jgi:hypothetical protein